MLEKPPTLRWKRIAATHARLQFGLRDGDHLRVADDGTEWVLQGDTVVPAEEPGEIKFVFE